MSDIVTDVGTLTVGTPSFSRDPGFYPCYCFLERGNWSYRTEDPGKNGWYPGLTLRRGPLGNAITHMLAACERTQCRGPGRTGVTFSVRPSRRYEGSPLQRWPPKVWRHCVRRKSPSTRELPCAQ